MSLHHNLGTEISWPFEYHQHVEVPDKSGYGSFLKTRLAKDWGAV
jgi:hypothetical protein